MKGFTFDEITVGDTTIYLCLFGNFNPFDYLDQLSEIEVQNLFSFKHIKRKKEFVATRILRHRVFGFKHIHYDSVGAPFIDDFGYISISHSKNMIGLAVNEHFKIGLDLEDHRASVLAVMHKFLSEEEKKIFDVNDPKEIIRVWSAKEALYKLAGRKAIHFKSELLLDKVGEENWHGIILNHNHQLLVELKIFDYNNTVVSINSKAIVKK